MFDVTNKESFDEVKFFLGDIDRYARENVVRVIVGNKSDLDSERVVETEAAKEFADSLGVPYFEVSAKTGSGVEDLFCELSRMILHKLEESSSAANTVNLNPPTQDTHKRPCVI